jgi:PPE-repeat protein
LRVQVVVRGKNHLRRQLVALLVLAPAVAGCSGASNMFSSDLLSKDAEWFSRPGRLFISNVSIDAPPLTPNKPIAPDDLVSAEGGCSGMPPPAGPADANALTDGAAGAPPAPTGTVALGHTECDVVRGIGTPDSVNISNDGRGDRVAVVTWLRGPRAGIYGFTAGRLSSVERAPEVEAAPKPARSPKPKRKPAAT